MPRRKKPSTQPPTETPTQAKIEAPAQAEAPVQAETKQQAPRQQLEIRKISHEEYAAYGNEKKESEYAKIAKMIVEKALESDTPILVKLPESVPARRVVPILSRIVSELWKSGTKIEFKASYKNNEVAIRVLRG
jgi:hypothetical protein